jgi:7,8-dihydro-6-hydroxymethylpterin-pyrophosphokinase
MSEARPFVVGIRSWKGSAGALTAAALDLLTTSPALEFMRQTSGSYRYEPKEGPAFLASAALFRSRLSVEQLLGIMHAVEERLADPLEPEARKTVRLELLWVKDVTLRTPEVSLPHPDFDTENWVITVFAEAGEAVVKDRGEAARFYALLQHPPGQTSVWQNSFGDPSQPKLARATGGAVVKSETSDPIELLAAAGEALILAREDSRALAREPAAVAKEFEPGNTARNHIEALRPHEIVTVTTPVGAGAGADERVARWLTALTETCRHSKLRPKAVVVFASDAALIRGALLGEQEDSERAWRIPVSATVGPLRPSRPPLIELSVQLRDEPTREP